MNSTSSISPSPSVTENYDDLSVDYGAIEPYISLHRINPNGIMDTNSRIILTHISQLSSFVTVISSCYPGSKIHDNGLYDPEVISKFGGLNGLTLIDCDEMSDVDLENIGRLSSLEYLVICNSKCITTLALSDMMSKLTNLKSLILSNVGVIGNASMVVKTIVDLPHLTNVCLSDWNVTDDDVVIIARNDHITDLSLMNCEYITDIGIHTLTGMKNLVTLNLNGTFLTGDDIPVLGDMVNLEHITLSLERITVSLLNRLCEMDKLKHITISSNGSEEGCHEIVEKYGNEKSFWNVGWKKEEEKEEEEDEVPEVNEVIETTEIRDITYSGETAEVTEV